MSVRLVKHLTSGGFVFQTQDGTYFAINADDLAQMHQLAGSSAGASGKWAGRWEAEGLCGCTGEISPSGAVPGACEHGSPTRVQSIRSTPEPSGNLAALRACAQAELDAMPNDTTLAGNLAVRRLCQAIMRTTPEPGENHAALIKELEGAAYDWGGAEPKYHHSLMMRAAKALCSCRYCSTPTKRDNDGL